MSKKVRCIHADGGISGLVDKSYLLTNGEIYEVVKEDSGYYWLDNLEECLDKRRFEVVAEMPTKDTNYLEIDQEAWFPKTGDKVLVWDDNDPAAMEKTFLCQFMTAKGMRYMCLNEGEFPDAMRESHNYQNMKRIDYRVMTQEEIEKALGYKVKIIGTNKEENDE